MRSTSLYRAYSAVSRVLLPFAALVERRKILRHGLPARRAREKLGHATEARPNGPLVWFHAASVGESLSVLSLITRLGIELPDAAFLITSGTPTSAELVSQRLPPRTRHQFAPLDAPGPVSRFLTYWKPDAALFVESELWPQVLMQTHRRGTPMALVNARMSERSLAAWKKRPKTAAMLLRTFQLILTQTDALADALRQLGGDAGTTFRGTNLKSLSAPLPVDAAFLNGLVETLQTRPTWVAASTHSGEEEIVLAAHEKLLEKHPDLCLLLAPRHPDRGGEIANLIAAKGWEPNRRSLGELPEGPAFLVDSLGEVGTLYTLSPIVFLGGSFSKMGGHNPFEVAHACGAVLTGPHLANFKDVFANMQSAGAAKILQNPGDLAAEVDHLLSDPSALATAQKASQATAVSQMDELDKLAVLLADRLELRTQS